MFCVGRCYKRKIPFSFSSFLFWQALNDGTKLNGSFKVQLCMSFLYFNIERKIKTFVQFQCQVQKDKY